MLGVSLGNGKNMNQGRRAGGLHHQSSSRSRRRTPLIARAGVNSFRREPALEEIRGMMFGGKLTIASQNGELFEELRNYHRDEDFRIVKQRDDLVSAMRYAIMMRRQGKVLAECEGFSYATPLASRGGTLSGHQQELARGVGFDVFTGQ